MYSKNKFLNECRRSLYILKLTEINKKLTKKLNNLETECKIKKFENKIDGVDTFISYEENEIIRKKIQEINKKMSSVTNSENIFYIKNKYGYSLRVMNSIVIETPEHLLWYLKTNKSLIDNLLSNKHSAQALDKFVSIISQNDIYDLNNVYVNYF